MSRCQLFCTRSACGRMVERFRIGDYRVKAYVCVEGDAENRHWQGDKT